MPKILTNPVFPPIPTNQFDWAAVEEGYEPGDRVGYGKTKDDAIKDLMEQMEE